MTDQPNKDVVERKSVPQIPLPQTDTGQASEEKIALDDEDYVKESLKKEHHRGEKLKDILHSLVKVSVIVVGVLLICGICIWAWHLLVPVKLHWLTTQQIFDIQKIMSSALLAIVISDYAKKYLK